jgi:hypothetical protein
MAYRAIDSSDEILFDTTEIKHILVPVFKDEVLSITLQEVSYGGGVEHKIDGDSFGITVQEQVEVVKKNAVFSVAQVRFKLSPVLLVSAHFK